MKIKTQQTGRRYLPGSHAQNFDIRLVTSVVKAWEKQTSLQNQNYLIKGA